MKNRIMGIDYGDVRTGIAISDLLGITAQGLESINHGESEKKLLNRIAEMSGNEPKNRVRYIQFSLPNILRKSVLITTTVKNPKA
jgi:putative Holliday junction resolvase